MTYNVFANKRALGILEFPMISTVYCDMVFEMKFLFYHVPQCDVTGLSMENHAFGSFFNILSNPGMQKVAKYVSSWLVCFFLVFFNAYSRPTAIKIEECHSLLSPKKG